jgi:hypothetical protein
MWNRGRKPSTARLPMPVVAQILRHVRGQKNMSGIAAFQRPSRNIYSRSCKVRFVVHIGDTVDWATVNPHPHLNAGMTLQGPANLESKPHRFLRAAEKKERHPISRWHSIKFAACFRSAKTFSAANNLVEFLERLNLLIDEQFRITHYIDYQDVRNLELEIGRRFRGRVLRVHPFGLSLRSFCLTRTLSQALMHRAHFHSPERTERSSRKS